MKYTYYGTTFREVKDCTVFIDVLSKSRYGSITRNDFLESFEYDNVTSWDIIKGGEEAEEIESKENIVDDNREYLVLHFEDDSTKTFRNSRVIMGMM